MICLFELRDFSAQKAAGLAVQCERGHCAIPAQNSEQLWRTLRGFVPAAFAFFPNSAGFLQTPLAPCQTPQSAFTAQPALTHSGSNAASLQSNSTAQYHRKRYLVILSPKIINPLSPNRSGSGSESGSSSGIAFWPPKRSAQIRLRYPIPTPIALFRPLWAAHGLKPRFYKGCLSSGL